MSLQDNAFSPTMNASTHYATDQIARGAFEIKIAHTHTHWLTAHRFSVS